LKNNPGKQTKQNKIREFSKSVSETILTCKSTDVGDDWKSNWKFPVASV